MLSFDTFHDTEEAVDSLFVEARTAGGDDWTTLEEQNGFTNQNVGACPSIIDANPFLDHYLTPVPDPDDPEDPEDDFITCDPVGTSGAWWAVSGAGFDWETGSSRCLNAGPDPIQIEVSITYASDPGFQTRGVTLDNLVVSLGDRRTSFEDDGDTLDGWVVADAPEGSGPNREFLDVDHRAPPTASAAAARRVGEGLVRAPA